jgi:hypothetical protein
MSPNSRNAYMAGLMDGEGSFSISKITKPNGKNIHYAPNIRLYNTNPKIINWTIQNFGGAPSWSSNNGGNIVGLKSQKKMCQWFLTGRPRMEKFILSILPYLRAKREQAELLLEYLRMNGRHDPPARQKLMERISFLNNDDDFSGTVETNTQDTSPDVKIESELVGDHESESTVM